MKKLILINGKIFIQKNKLKSKNINYTLQEYK